MLAIMIGRNYHKRGLLRERNNNPLKCLSCRYIDQRLGLVRLCQRTASFSRAKT
jgi:hypothetical protein